MKVIIVSAVALIDRDGRVLIAQRPSGKSMEGLWEFPGGKIEPGETPEDALIRELYEELGIETGVNLETLIDVGRLAEDIVGHQLPSELVHAGSLNAFRRNMSH